MAETYIDKSLKKIQFMIGFSGLALHYKYMTKMQKFKVRVMYLINCAWLNTDVIGAVVWFINGLQTKPFVELTYIAPCIAFTFVGNLKSFFLLRYNDTISDLIDNLLELESKDEEGDTERDKIKHDAIRFLHAVLKYSHVLSFVLSLTFFVGPLSLIVINYIETNKLELILPFMISYPFDSHDIHIWPFVYIHQCGSVLIILADCYGPDYIVFICCTHLYIQFRTLQYDISKIVSQQHIPGSDEEDFERKLIKLVKWHQELIRLSGELELSFSNSTLGNFVASSIVICLTGFNVAALLNIAYAVMFFCFLTASLLQIYMLCFFGDMLLKSSTEVSDAIYSCLWYNLSLKSRKNLMIIQQRAQKPCKLTACGFSDVNLKSFMSVLSSSWSYFALLKTIYNPTKNEEALNI